MEIDWSTQWWVKHDMSSFSGRFMHWAIVANPINSFHSNSQATTIRNELAAEAEAANFKTKSYTKAQYADLLQKKRVCLTCVHPDTNEVIDFPCRVSAFTPMNIPIIGAMMLAPPSVKSTIFWQFVNQTYNAGFNYGNRNATSETNNAELAKSYGIACTSAITTAMVLRTITNPLLKGASGVTLMAANACVNYGAVGVSSSLNLYFMRSAEMTNGISVLDPKTNETLGKSKIAAKRGIEQTIQTRWAYLIPIFWTAPILSGGLSAMRLLPQGGAPRKAIDIVLIMSGLTLAIPTCCGMFPQIAEI